VLYCFLREHPLAPDNILQTAQRFRLPPPASGLKILTALQHILMTIVLVLVGGLAGRRMLSMAGIQGREGRPGDRWFIVEELTMALGLGWGFLMYLTFALGVVEGLYSAVMLSLLVLIPLVCLREIPGVVGDVKAVFAREKAGGRAPAATLGTTVLALMLVLLLIIALSPIITHDAMVYHLNVPQIYADEGRILAIPYNLFSNTFLNVGMLYTAALLIGEFILANMVHFVFGLGTLAVLYSAARRNFGRTTAVLAVLMFFFNPTVLNEMPIAYVDMGLVFYFVLSLLCLWRWKTEGNGRWFALACIFAGIFAGIKYTSIHGLAAIAVMIALAEFLSSGRSVGRTAGRLAIFGGVVTLFVLPYLVKNFLLTGNPVYPLMYGIFDGRWLAPVQVERMLAYVSTHGMGRDWRSLLALPWNITVHGGPGYAHFDAVITPLWLMFVPAVVLVRNKSAMLKWAVIACVAYFLSWAASTHITRYLMPLFPVLSLISARTVVALKEETREFSPVLSRILMAGAVAVCCVVWFGFAYSYPLRVPPEFGPVLWGNQTTDEFQARRIPNYPVFRYINDTIPTDARLAFFWDNRGFLCERPQIGDSVFEAPSMIELVHEAGTAAELHERLSRMGITHILFNRFFMMRFPVQTVSPYDAARLTNDFVILQDFLSRYCTPLYTADDATLYAMQE
jgi:hypothetical protein